MKNLLGSQPKLTRNSSASDEKIVRVESRLLYEAKRAAEAHFGHSVSDRDVLQQALGLFSSTHQDDLRQQALRDLEALGHG